MKNNVISPEEFRQFKSLTIERIIDSMEAYLIGINGRKHNMGKVGAIVFGNGNDSWKVSLIHRCYNFSGDNSGKYAPGCKFEQAYGYRVTREDIEDFVMTYPDGTFSIGITFDDFLLEKITGQITQESELQSVPRAASYQFDVPNSSFNIPNSNAYNHGDNQTYNEQAASSLIIVGYIGVLILLIMLFTGNLFKHWVVSLVVLFITVGVFSIPIALKDDGKEEGTYASIEKNRYYGNALGSRKTARVSKIQRPVNRQKAYRGIRFNILDRLRGKSLSSILTSILVLVLIGKLFISAVITHEPASTRFWALYIAIATTKGMIFDAKNIGLFGKLLILGLVWLAAYNYM